jgi:hypothetical protein
LKTGVQYIRALGATTIIVGIIYLNVASVLRFSYVRFPPASPNVQGALPNHWIGEEIFSMFGLFGRVMWDAVSYRAMGSTNRLSSIPLRPTDKMIDLRIYDYFNHSLGEANSRLGLNNYQNNDKRSTEAFHHMATTLMNLHNRRYPDEQVAQVIIYVKWWPKSKEGYFHRESEAEFRVKGYN